VRFLFLILILWSIIACGLAAALTFYGQTDTAQPADVIVVLGSGLVRNDRPGPALYRRSVRAAELWREGYAPVIICTGGFTAGRSRSEADACGEVLRENGVAADAIMLEEQSRSTLENALYTRQIMNANGWNDALIVSDGFHLLRATWLFGDQGIHVVGHSPAANARLSTRLYNTVREVFALHWQLLITVFDLPMTYVPVL
jgi:uncharacterized SAM-binding protein YcdF (DUF218 family)